MKTNMYKSTFVMMLASFGSMAQTQQFNTAGNHTFTAPDGVLSVKVEAVGAGGGGGRVRGSSARESGGGGGGAYAKGIVNVTSGTNYTIAVGAAGIQNDNAAQHGGNSFFGSASSTDASTTVRAEGGKTLILSDGSSGTGAEGGKATNSVGNKAKYNGGNGGNTSSNDYGGGGGGAAGSNGAGGNGGQGSSGIGTASYGGNGGAGGVSGGDDDGVEGYNYGGGGGGARKSFSGSTVNRYGSGGAKGLVVVSWSTITDFSPAAICAGSNELITVTGTNFTSIDSVTVNGTSLPFTPIDNTQFSVQVPSGSTSGNIIVYTENGSAISLSTLTIYDYSLNVSLQGSTLTATFTGSSNAVYQWKNCVTGSPISGAVGTTYTPTQNGLYAVEVTENGCTSSSQCITVASVGVETLTANEMEVFPNPASGNVTIDTKDFVADLLILTDLNGREILKMTPSGTVSNLQITDLNTGFYLIRVIFGEQSHTERLSVIH
jgi:hypothetical protein